MSQITNYSNNVTPPLTGVVKTLTGNTGGAVPPDGSGNIDIVGTGGITVTGDIGDNTLTIDDGGSASTFIEDFGFANPIDGVINIIGGNNIQTVGNDLNTITIELSQGLDGQVLIGATSGFAEWENITSIDESITITNGPNSIDLSAVSMGVNTFDTDSGTATPTAGVIDIKGGLNINTSGATNVVTINLDNSIHLPDTNTAQTSGTIFLNNVAYFSNFGGTGGGGGSSDNLFLGPAGNTTLSSGTDNTGIGSGSLHALDTGSANVAIGISSLSSLTDGSNNNSVGFTASVDVTTGSNNCAFGYGSLGGVTTGSGNTAIGFTAISSAAATSSFNTSIGVSSLSSGCGDYNIAIGYNAGVSLSDTSSDSNLYISNPGSASESNVIRIGAQGTGSSQQDACYVAGIYNTSVGATTQVAIVDSAGKLGSSTGTDGEILIGSTAGSPVWSTITPGTNITITNASNSITINASGGGVGLTWTEITSSTVSLVSNNGYITNNNTGVTGTLPATAAIGDIIAIVGNNSGGWVIAQNAGQTIHYGQFDTTTGVTGSLASTMTYDCVEIVCVTIDTDFVVRSSVGNLSVT